jgi:hypothetical protein
MARRKKTEDEKKRLKRLRKEARKIIGKMDQHKLFGFILHHRGKKAIPMLMELWGGGMMSEEKESGSETKEEAVEEKVAVEAKEEKPESSPDDLVELVLEDSKKQKDD